MFLLQVSSSKTTKTEKSRESSVLHKIPEVILDTVNLTEEYNILKVLAEGYFAKIFLADNRRTNTTVVLKGVHAELTSLKDFYREYHYSYHLSPHPNILSTYSVAFKADDFFIFAQEYAPYGDLAGTVKAGGLCEDYCKKIAVQLCSALEFVHSKQLVHRDVKLENVLVFAPDFSKLKLCDFGETRKEGTLVGKVKCTWQPFLPPEQCDALRNEKFTCRRYSDCWQAAIVLFVCATGNTPWQIAQLASNADYMNFAKWQKRRTTKVPMQFKKFTPRLLRMFRRLLAHKPEDRAEITEPFKYFKDSWFVTKSGQNTPIERKNSEDIYLNMDDDDDDDVHIEVDESKTRMAKMLSSYGLETTVDQKTMSKRLQEWVLSCESEFYDSNDEENF